MAHSVSPEILYLFLKTDKLALIRLAGGGAQPNISQKIVREFQIPLPPLATQQAIVAEIEAEQALVAANQRTDHPLRAKDPGHPRLHLGRSRTGSSGGVGHERA